MATTLNDLLDPVEPKSTDTSTDPPTEPVVPMEPVEPAEPVSPPPANPTPQEPGDPQESADDPQEPTSPEEFFSVLDQMYGEELNNQIDYGDTDPLSPQGVYMREQFIAQRAAMQFEESLKHSDPRAYAYFLHRKNGGSDEDFYTRPSVVLPPLHEIKESVDLQRKVYERALLARGNSEKQAQALIKLAAEEGTLEADAESAWNEIKDREEQEFRKAEALNAQRIEKEKKDLTKLDEEINKTILSGSSLKFIIPDAEKQNFSQAFKELVHYDNGQFYLVKPLSLESLGKNLEAELFNYLNGDLSKLVQRKAVTVTAKRTINRIKQQQQPVSGSGSSRTAKTIGDII